MKIFPIATLRFYNQLYLRHLQLKGVAIGSKYSPYSHTRLYFYLLRNSATVIAVAIAALSDSEPGWSAGYGGM